ncbi:hypothetical protein LTR86_000190 [Recurvomyces mirabilis]|nr:hypothetical protein LTR86_000190 [Recurvomyces mirabilis]
MDMRDTAVSWNNAKISQKDVADRMKDLERSLEFCRPDIGSTSSGLGRSRLPYRPSIQHNRLQQVRKASSDSTPTTSVSASTPSTNSTSLWVPLMIAVNHSTKETHIYTVVRSLNIHGPTRSVKADILLVRNSATARLFVEKRLYTPTVASQKRANSEVHALQQIRDRDCPTYINKMFDIFLRKDDGFCSLILEYCDAGTVEDKILILLQAGVPPVEGLVWHILAGLAKAIYFCHTGIDAAASSQARLYSWTTLCHLATTPSNVFLSTDGGHSDYPRVVLGDFGSATPYIDIMDSQAPHPSGPRLLPGWFPPECNIIGCIGNYGTTTDIWQMGGVAQALCRLLKEPDMERVDFGRPAGKAYGKELNGFITYCMQREASKRPDAKTAVEWLRTDFGKRETIF